MWQFRKRNWSSRQWIAAACAVAAMVVFIVAMCVSGVRQPTDTAKLAAFSIPLIFLAVLWYMVRRQRKLHGDGPYTDERERVIRRRCNLAACATVLLGYWLLYEAVLVNSRMSGQRIITLNVDWLHWGFTLSLSVFLLVRWGMGWWIRRQERADGE